MTCVVYSLLKGSKINSILSVSILQLFPSDSVNQNISTRYTRNIGTVNYYGN